jgi:hypothetical protein
MNEPITATVRLIMPDEDLGPDFFNRPGSRND